MDVDKLLVVAHPDDELLWGGCNLLSQPGWFVLCSTHVNDPVRSTEFYNTMSYCNVTRYMMCDVNDEYTDNPSKADELYDGSGFEKALNELSQKKWSLVLSHSEEGEYGHEHHKKVHRMVQERFPSAKFFTPSKKLSDSNIEKKRRALLFYRKTQDICKKIFNKKGNTLKAIERDYFFRETLFVKPIREIPLFVHQIWFGKPLASSTVRYHLMNNVQKTAKNYKLWTNEDLTLQNFPLTFEFMQIAIKMGEEVGQSRYAQVADLARLEILHRFGGIYLDSLFEIGSEFLKYIHKHRHSELIVANEDPCGLKCKGSHGKHYMSNGFFAAVPGCSILKRLLNYDVLESVDYEEVRINQTTGPYFFRSAFKSSDKIHVIPTEKIYPFMVNDSEYRKGQPNQCVQDEKVLHDCLHKKYPKSLAVYHSGFGGSWSW
jgi:LmbE family N-acetylglucosaminyl deacetylase